MSFFRCSENKSLILNTNHKTNKTVDNAGQTLYYRLFYDLSSIDISVLLCVIGCVNDMLTHVRSKSPDSLSP